MQNKDSQGDPTVATLLTWFVPGAGHLYLGRPLFALVAFLLVEGVYLLGLWLTDGRAFEILPAEMRSQFAPFLAPELGNLGAMLLQSSRFGFGTGSPSVWPDTMNLGMALTSFGGILNVLLMSRAHFDARASKAAPGLRPEAAALACWVLPGLGQILQGRRRRGILMFVMLVGLFAIGTTMGEGANLDRERHFYYWSGQFLLGIPAVVVEFVHGHQRVTGDIAYADAGVVIGCIAGMLNVLSMLDAFAYGEDQLEGRASAKAEGREAAA